MRDVKEKVSITLPLYQWLIILGALSALGETPALDRLSDELMEVVQP